MQHRSPKQGIWHLQKVIAKLIEEIMDVNLSLRDKRFIVQGTISKAKKHFGTKLLQVTLNNFIRSIDDLWENFKCNKEMSTLFTEEYGLDWFNKEFGEYHPFNTTRHTNVKNTKVLFSDKDYTRPNIPYSLPTK